MYHQGTEQVDFEYVGYLGRLCASTTPMLDALRPFSPLVMDTVKTEKLTRDARNVNAMEKSSQRQWGVHALPHLGTYKPALVRPPNELLLDFKPRYRQVCSGEGNENLVETDIMVIAASTYLIFLLAIL